MMWPRTNRDIVQICGLAAAYTVAGVITLSLPETVLELRRMIWPASGIALGWLMLGGIRLWPGVLIGAALTTAITGGPALHIVGTGVANTAEIVLAVWLLGAAGLTRRIETRWDLLIFLGVLGVTTAISAALSVASLVGSDGLAFGSAGTVWLNWWLTHAMGQIVFTPLILSVPWVAGPPPRLPVRESIIMMAGLGVALLATFTPLSPPTLRAAPLAFLSFPFLFWAAYRCGQFGASSASLSAAAFAVTGTLLGIGPFVHPSPNTSLALTLLFVSSASFSTLFVAGLVEERRRAEREREKMERRLHRSEKLESLGALAGGIAHDFNNLLVAIAGNVDLVLMDTDPGSPAFEPLKQSVQASERAAELCRQLLAYAGQGPFEHAVVDLRPIVEEMTELLRVTVPKGTEVEYDLGPDVIPVRADVSQLRRVVINLFSNAGDALHRGQGRIRISTWSLDSLEDFDEGGAFFLEPPAGPLALLRAEDNGEGIRQEHLERIFEPVFSTRGMGRGLGLASVLGIMRSHGGAIHVRSAPGEGSRFTLLFPRAAAAVEAVPVPPVRPPIPHSGAALIVDDEAAVRQAASMLVGRLGFDTVVAPDGPSALHILQDHDGDFRWILLDMTMPQMDGLETLRQIRARGWEVPVLLSSGYVLRPAELMSELGPARFLAKPYSLSALDGAVEDLLRLDRRQPPESDPEPTPPSRRGSSLPPRPGTPPR